MSEEIKRVLDLLEDVSCYVCAESPYSHWGRTRNDPCPLDEAIGTLRYFLKLKPMLECVCSETSSRNCPVHGNEQEKLVGSNLAEAQQGEAAKLTRWTEEYLFRDDPTDNTCYELSEETRDHIQALYREIDALRAKLELPKKKEPNPYICEVCEVIECEEHPVCDGCGNHVEKVMDSGYCRSCMGDDSEL